VEEWSRHLETSDERVTPGDHYYTLRAFYSYRGVLGAVEDRNARTQSVAVVGNLTGATPKGKGGKGKVGGSHKGSTKSLKGTNVSDRTDPVRSGARGWTSS